MRTHEQGKKWKPTEIETICPSHSLSQRDDETVFPLFIVVVCCVLFAFVIYFQIIFYTAQRVRDIPWLYMKHLRPFAVQ